MIARPILAVLLGVLTAGLAGAGQEKKAGKRPPVAVTYYLAGIDDAGARDALGAALTKVKGVVSAAVAPRGEHVTVRFDSHVVSYHQVAQAITDADRRYAPTLKIQVPAYAEGDNAAKVDALFAGKRLNQRVRIAPLDKARGEFVIHFLPLELDPAVSGPQGFNGGHLNHPVHDAPPRGLGLTFRYVAE